MAGRTAGQSARQRAAFRASVASGAQPLAQPLRVGPGFIRAGFRTSWQGLGEHERGGWDLIGRQHDQMVKYATALRLRTAEAQQILRRFARGGPKHPTYQAITAVSLRAVRLIPRSRSLTARWLTPAASASSSWVSPASSRSRRSSLPKIARPNTSSRTKCWLADRPAKVLNPSRVASFLASAVNDHVVSVGRETGSVASSGLSSVFAGFRFPPEVISVAVRWYLRYGLSYRDVEELLAERGVTVDHVTIYRWVQRFTPEFIEAARPCRHVSDDRWFVDETYLKVAGQWAYLYRAVDQHGQVIDVLVSARRDLAAARCFLTRALRAGAIPVEVTTDRAPAYPRVLDELIPSALHTVEQYANNPGEADHGRLKARLRPMRGLKRHRSARILSAGHAFIQNLRRGHYDIATDVPRPPQAPQDLRRVRPVDLTGVSKPTLPSSTGDRPTQQCPIRPSSRD